MLTGLALGAAVATATAFITDLDAGPGGVPTRRAGIVATTANIGGLACGPLIAGLLARYEPHGLTLPFTVFLAALIAAVAAVILAPEGHPAVHPRPRYHPQRLTAPANGRRQFAAATTGAFTAFAVGGLLAGLTGTFLAGPLHQPSPALTGLAIFLTFGSGVLVQTTTTSWPAPPGCGRDRSDHHRPVRAGRLGMDIAPEPRAVPDRSGRGRAGIGAIIRGSLTVVITTAGPDDRAGALATFFIAGYAGVSLPVVGVGLALQHLSPRVTLLIFAVAVTVVILAAAPILVRPAAGATQRPGPDSDPMTALCRGFGEHADRPAGGCQRLGPADRSFAGQPERRRPIRKSGRTQHPTLGTLHRKTSEAGPEHLPTSSLPTLRACSGDGSVPACVTDSPVMGLSAGSIGGLRRCGGRARRRALHLVMRV